MRERVLLFGCLFALTMYAEGSAVELKSVPIQREFLNGLSSPPPGVPAATATNLSGSDVQPSAQLGQSEGKSLVKTVLFSVLVPGGGEYYLGNRGKAKFFFAAEVLTWITYFGFRTYGDWNKDDMIKFAADRAGADIEGRSDQFEDWVGFYSSIDQFNRTGREADPDRPFLEDNASNHWRWQSDADRNTYRDMKNAYRENYRGSDFALGFAMVNRIVSVVDAVRDFRRLRRRVEDPLFGMGTVTYEVEVNPFAGERQLSVTFYPGF